MSSITEARQTLINAVNDPDNDFSPDDLHELHVCIGLLNDYADDE